MKWERINDNVYTNKDQTVIKVAKLSDLFKNENVDNMADIEIESQTNGRSATARPKNIIRMTSKLGTTAYFDPELVNPFKSSDSILYLFPMKKENMPPVLIISNPDVVYVVFPCELDKFVEIPNLDKWI